MNTLLRSMGLSLMLTLALASVGGAQDAKPQPQGAAAPAATRPAEPTIVANRVLRIAWDRRVSFPHLESLVTRNPATVEAAKKFLGLSKPYWVSVKVSRSDENEADVILSISLPPHSTEERFAGAAEYADAIVAMLPRALTEYQTAAVERDAARVRMAADVAADHLERLRAHLDQQRRRLREITGRADAVDNWASAIASLEQERQKLSLDLAGQQARRQAIEKTVAAITKEAGQRAEGDPIAAELAKIVKIRETELAMAGHLVKEARMNPSEAANIEATVADAKAKLLERRELAMRFAGGELLADMNRELMMLAITGAENEARLNLIKDSLNRFHESASEVDRIKSLEKDLAAQETTARGARERLNAHEDQYRGLRPPTVTVIDSGNTTLAEWRKQNPDAK